VSQQGVFPAGDDHQRMWCEGDGNGVQVRWRAAHDRQVNLVVGEQTTDRFTVVDQQAKADVGLCLAEFGQQTRSKVLRRTGDGDRNPPTLESLECQQSLVRLLQ